MGSDTRTNGLFLDFFSGVYAYGVSIGWAVADCEYSIYDPGYLAGRSPYLQEFKIGSGRYSEADLDTMVIVWNTDGNWG